jgi:hypothetical protein
MDSEVTEDKIRAHMNTITVEQTVGNKFALLALSLASSLIVLDDRF